ncbi:MAG: ribonuclease HII [Candidatus Omnitrophica bacterium]|nr:ribonuclease HII [Candidatus Omnitrophota bacterium]
MARLPAAQQDFLMYETKAKANGFRFVFGVDEAGRGPLAGPVVAGAVLLKDTHFENLIADSKLLSPRQRDRAFLEIQERAWFGIGIMNEKVIDEINILRAAHLAMTAAVHDLVQHLPVDISGVEDFRRSVKVLIDGNLFTGRLPYSIETIVGGDGKSLSIACASIIAKVTRDRIIEQYDQIYPQYGFKAHKGYPTLVHREAIRKFGLSPIHRKTFRVS